MTENEFIRNMKKIEVARLPDSHKEVYKTIVKILNEKHDLENILLFKNNLTKSLWERKHRYESIIGKAQAFIEKYNKQQNKKIFKHKIPNELLNILSEWN